MFITSLLGLFINLIMARCLHGDIPTIFHSHDHSHGNHHHHHNHNHKKIPHEHEHNHNHEEHLISENKNGCNHDNDNDHDHSKDLEVRAEPLIVKSKSKNKKRNRKVNLSMIKVEHNANIQAAFIHILGDILQSIGVIVISGVIWLAIELKGSWRWKILDPIISILFSIIAFGLTIPIFKKILRFLMDFTPPKMDVEQFREELL